MLFGKKKVTTKNNSEYVDSSTQVVTSKEDLNKLFDNKASTANIEDEVKDFIDSLFDTPQKKQAINNNVKGAK